MNYKDLFLGAFLFLVGQTVVWYQINGQFLNNWVKEHPWAMSLLGIPISYCYIWATYYTVAAFDGSLWPQRLIGFAMGMFSFAILTYVHLNETIDLKTGVTLILATSIVLIQVFWK
jgi:amino acid transporter